MGPPSADARRQRASADPGVKGIGELESSFGFVVFPVIIME